MPVGSLEKPALVNRLILDYLAEDLPPQTMLPVRRRPGAAGDIDSRADD